MDDQMIEAARRALVFVLGFQKDERVVVVTDSGCAEVGKAFFEAGMKAGGAAIYYLQQKARPLGEIPEDLLEAAAGCTVAVTCFSSMPEETPFRLKLLRQLMTTCTRLGHAPGITAEMMTEGPMNVDYADMRVRAETLMRRLEGAVKASIVAPGGTDLTLDIAGRGFATDVRIPPGKWGNLPAGEIWCGPVENRGDGVMVCDGSIGDLGQPPAPVTIKVEKGKVISVECPDPEFGAQCLRLLRVDDWADRIGELGIGLNPGARITGVLLEDEKAGRTAHVAFGCNTDMPGGRNTSSTHRDFLFLEPTITITYANGAVRTLLREGEVTEE